MSIEIDGQTSSSATASTYAVEIDNLSVWFGQGHDRVDAVKSASFELPSGASFGLVGESGSGKSTILRVIAGLNRPAQGRVLCAGATWLDTEQRLFLKPQQRRVGMVLQQYALFPHLSARQNVEQGCRHLPRQQRRARADYWLERVNLSGLQARRPAQLSGGAPAGRRD